MESNIGKIDKILRIIVGVLLIIVGYYYNLWILYLISVVLLATAIFSNCPIYHIFKIKTNNKK